MRIYKRILYLFLVSIILMSLTACESNNSSSDNSNNNKSTSNDNTQSEYDQYNLLSFGKIEIDKTPRYEGDTYYYFKVKVTNNSDEALRTVSPDMSVYDKNNTVITTLYDQKEVVKPGESFYMESLMEGNENIDHVEINNYSYFIGKTFYQVDTISKVVDISEFTD